MENIFSSDLFKRMAIGTLIGIAVGCLIAFGTHIKGFFLTDTLDGYEFRSYDARMKARAHGQQEASLDSIVIIDIEQNSVAELGNFKDWPHAYHGQLMDVVSSGNPQAILFDILFDPENTLEYDLIKTWSEIASTDNPDLSQFTDQYLAAKDPDRFIQATRESGIVYHALVFETADSNNFLYAMDTEPEGFDWTDQILHIPLEQARHLPTAERLGNTYVELLSAAQRTGSANFPQDADGITRRAPTAIYFEGPQHVYPSLTMAAVMDLLGIPQNGFDYDFDAKVLRLSDTTGTVIREIPIDDEGRMYVNYAGFFKTFYYIPYSYCFNPDMLHPSYWQDRIAIIGSSLPGLMDLRNTPVQETFSGVEIHANVLRSLLKDQFVHPAGATQNGIVILSLSVILGLIVSMPKKPMWTLPVPILIAAGWTIFAYSQFISHLVMWEIVRPVLTLGTTYLGVFLYNFLVVEKDKRFLRSTFSTYISPELIDRMYERKEEPQLGGEEGVHTAFFSDIQSFSVFSEILSPAELVDLLNEYLTELTDILLENNGTLDKYIGDAIVAFYGAPAPVENHAWYACRTALQMQQRLAELRERWKSQEDRWPAIVHEMQTRMGINSGPMVTGNMGSRMRMNYTMMGDTVNLAARLEASAKQYGVYIQVAESTYREVQDQFEWRELDFVRVMGKAQPVTVYELLAEKGELTAADTELLNVYNDALSLYKAQRWNEAFEKFKEADTLEIMFPGRKTNPSRTYRDRCEYFQANPPGDDWDGVWVMTSK